MNARPRVVLIGAGGVSTGEADYVKSAVEAIGRLVFWRVAIKPGRPVAMGVIQARKGVWHGSAILTDAQWARMERSRRELC